MAYPTTFLDLQNAVIGKLRLDATADLQRVKDWINQMYAHVIVDFEALQTSTTLTLAANTSTYTLPAAVARIKFITATPVGGSQGPPLDEATLEQILAYRQTGQATASTGGSVTAYALLGLNQLEVYPTPTAADTLTIWHVYLPTALSGNTDVPVLQEPWPKVIEYGALIEGADFIKDPNVNSYLELYDVWRRRFRAHVTRRGGGGPQQIPVVGGPRLVAAAGYDNGR